MISIEILINNADKSAKEFIDPTCEMGDAQDFCVVTTDNIAWWMLSAGSADVDYSIFLSILPKRQ
jgi:hypothetical protein